jgi:hypothetical protein
VENSKNRFMEWLNPYEFIGLTRKPSKGNRHHQKRPGFAGPTVFKTRKKRQEHRRFFLADDFWPVGVEHFAAWLVSALVSVGTEEVALGLQ